MINIAPNIVSCDSILILATFKPALRIKNTFGQEGAFEEMIGWSEDIFHLVAEDFELELEGV